MKKTISIILAVLMMTASFGSALAQIQSAESNMVSGEGVTLIDADADAEEVPYENPDDSGAAYPLSEISPVKELDVREAPVQLPRTEEPEETQEVHDAIQPEHAEEIPESGAEPDMETKPDLQLETEFIDETEEIQEEAEAETSLNLIEYDYDELNVAGVTPMTGNFFSPLWGNVTSDMDVRMLVHGYDLVHWETDQGMFMIDDTVVSGVVVTEDTTGNRTFTIALYNDLFYSDGTPITAADYAFSMLLSMAPEVEAIGGNVKRPVYLLGYEDYITGAAPYLAGFRILAEDQFSITVSAEYLPFFYELGLLDCTPYPISVIAPGVRVADDGDGIYLTNIDGGESPIFTADLLRETLLNEETGYLTHPAVSSGPYRLVSYDGTIASFETNEYYKGDAHGFTPNIERLTYRTLSNDELVPALEDGTVGLLNKLTTAETIQDAMRAVSSNPQLTTANYPRTGLAFISFNTEREPVNDLSVRAAIAWQMDKDAFVAETVNNFGLRADGYYGMGQWMYQLLTGAIAYPVAEDEMDPAELAEWEALTMDDIPTYEQDPEEAARLLDEAGWNLNASGETFRAGNDPLRYKRIDGELVPLNLTMAAPEDSSAIDALHTMAETLAEAGISLSIDVIPLEDLLTQYYHLTDRTYDMFFLASNFDALFDPSANFVLNEAGEHVWVETGLADEELYEDAVAMRMTEAGDLIGYCKQWLKFQTRFAETLPMIPLYSNVYFDFYPQVLHDYNISSNLSWSQAVIPAYMSDVEEVVEETVEEDEFIADGMDLIEFDD